MALASSFSSSLNLGEDARSRQPSRSSTYISHRTSSLQHGGSSQQRVPTIRSESRVAHASQPPPLPPKPCDVCGKTIKTFHCVFCVENYCDLCWDEQRPHKLGKLVEGKPHQKTDLNVVKRLKATFAPPADEATQRRLHVEDENSAWFGIERESHGPSTFHDYGRFATLMADGASGTQSARYPQLVSFIGQTGAGKSTIIKMLIDQQSGTTYFPRPVVGSVRDDKTPTSGDVHLYADPSTYRSSKPLLYADCEGLEGGEADPISAKLKESDASHYSRRGKTDVSDARMKLRKKWKIARGSQRELVWANTPETRKRQYAVTELYPRLMYTFSDTIVFVLSSTARTFESAVLSKLINWAHDSMEKSLNQPTLPHAIIVINATDIGVAESEWDVALATTTLMASINDALHRNMRYRELAVEWRNRGKKINTTQDLLLCYYSSVQVVRIPMKGHYMLIDGQVTKLRDEIVKACDRSHQSKRETRMLSNSDELHVLLQSGFDHFSRNLHVPFNFIEVAWKNIPIPEDFGGSILQLAAAMKARGIFQEDHVGMFTALSNMVASCIMLDCARHNLRGSMAHLLETYFKEFVEYALEDYCSRFCQCTFSNEHGRCVNVFEGHAKGHQNNNGRVIGDSAFQCDFTYHSFQPQWLEMLHQATEQLQNDLTRRMHSQFPAADEKALAGKLHRDTIQFFYSRLGGAEAYSNHAACFCCLRDLPMHPLPCGHVLCTACVYAYGTQLPSHEVRLDDCPLHAGAFHLPWKVKFKPPLAGVRILTLDGGGIRGIVELQVLWALERMLGGKIPIHTFFDLVVGTSTGGLLALGIGVHHWRLHNCVDKFIRLVKVAFTRRVPFPSPKYVRTPFRGALKNELRDEPLFGGCHEMDSSYHTKVAVTAVTEATSRPVIFSNYNRTNKDHGECMLIRPDNPEHEILLWEAALATSAAPGYFKSFVNSRTNERYVDGALVHNNPVKVAYRESKLLWPEVEDLHPDILLSLGTGHRGSQTEGSGETIAWRKKPSQEDDASAIGPAPVPKERLKKLGNWLNNRTVIKYLSLAINRADNLLDAELAWYNFYSEIDNNELAQTRRRYRRFNPDLGYPPPKLDDKGTVEDLKYDVSQVLKSPKYTEKLAKIANRLIASSFYFENHSDSLPQDDGGYIIKGKIQCRFSDGSKELRSFGELLAEKQDRDFQPYFSISEAGREERVQTIVIDPNAIVLMSHRSQFDVGNVEIYTSERMGKTTITLTLGDRITYPISGFPCALIQNHLTRVPSGDIPQASEKLRSRRSTRHIRRSTEYSDPGADQKIFETRHQTGPESQKFPFSPSHVTGWMHKRSRLSVRTETQAERPDTPRYASAPGTYSGSASNSLYAPSISSLHSRSQSEIAMPVGYHELPTQTLDSEDEDEVQLKMAIAMSLRDAETRLEAQAYGNDQGSYTEEAVELEVALERSRIEQ